jgi:hypothetical protein
MRLIACVLESGAQSTNVSADDCANRQQNAHITERRVIVYRWHPWHGRAVLIVSAVSKGAMASFRCRLDEQDSRSLEVPQWMFDAATCCRFQQASAPIATCKALREVRALIETVERNVDGPTLQAEHPIAKLTGGAHAKQEPSTRDRSAGAVRSACAAVGLIARLLRQHARGVARRRRRMSRKIQSQHLARKAVLYVRQSSAFQVTHNPESQKLQYAVQNRLRISASPPWESSTRI